MAPLAHPPPVKEAPPAAVQADPLNPFAPRDDDPHTSAEHTMLPDQSQSHHSQSVVTNTVTVPTPAPTPATTIPRSWDDVAAHASPDDAWIVIRGRVYDVTAFTHQHPGGDILLTAAGMDATDVFAAFHSGTDAWKALPALCVGFIDDSLAPSKVRKVDRPFLDDVLQMRKTIQSLALFRSSKLYYAAKVLTNVAILSASILLLLLPTQTIDHPTRHHQPWPTVLASAFLLALFWQQCGWLAHDFLHHQVFLDRRINNCFGILIGNIWQGFSVSWWKNKHNHHHAVPNVTEALSGGDPDIQTMPILFWSEKLMDGEDLDKLPRFLLRNQALFYWPILCMARISWLIQSVQYQLLPRNSHVTGDLMYAAEVGGLFIHHAAYLLLISRISSLPKLLAFCTISQALGGLFIGLVFTVGHNAREVLTPEEYQVSHFVNLQLRTTCNVTPSIFNDWFTGGLNYQIEHHLWPTLPRHALPQAAVILKAFCAKHNVPYVCKGLVEGNMDVWQLLAAIGKNAS